MILTDFLILHVLFYRMNRAQYVYELPTIYQEKDGTPVTVMQPGGGHGNYGTVQVVPATASVIHTNRPRWSWATTIWSTITLWLCCPFFGFMGLLYSVLSYTDHHAEEYELARKKRNCAWGFVITGIVVAVVIVIVILVVYFTSWDSFRNWISGAA